MRAAAGLDVAEGEDGEALGVVVDIMRLGVFEMEGLDLDCADCAVVVLDHERLPCSDFGNWRGSMLGVLFWRVA